MLKVCKFGGSSLSDAKHFKQVKAIIEADPDRKCVIVSAPGKGEGECDKITDLLYLCFQHRKYHVEFDGLFERIEQRYLKIKKELNIDYPIENDLKEIREALKEKTLTEAKLVSRGEYLCAKLLAAYLGYSFIDAKDVIHFKFDGKVDEKKTSEDIAKAFAKVEKAVIPGFYGSYPNGEVCLFSRGGSDVSASYFAEALDAYLYENFTDVSGFYMADPRIVDDPKIIQTITYRELRELSYMGATVLHEDAIFPVKKAGIPIHIKNTNAPEDEGTLIVTHTDKNNESSVLTGIAGKKGFTVLTLEKDMMNEEIGFGRRLLNVLEKNGMSFEHLPSGIDTMSVVVNDHELEGKEDVIISELMSSTMPDSISIEKNIALIAVVGRGMKNAKGTAASVFRALADEDINIRMIDQGSSELNIIVGVDNSDFEKSIKTIYSKFVK